MNNSYNHITLFEHQALKADRLYNGVLFTEKHRLALESFYGETGLPYYKLIHRGVQFNEFVGVLQMGNLTIEVLPKADKYSNKNDWRTILIGMLKAVGAFDIHAPSTSALKVKSNFILDLYFELFIREVEYLFNKGLIKRYRSSEGNKLALKGRILFSKHIQQNIVHQERFYTKYSTYDQIHLIHKILYKTLLLLKHINTNVSLKSRIGNLLLNFPEMNNLSVTEEVFEKLVLDRKSKDYKNTLEISKLLLLNYHPDLSNGQNNVLALMFDMNLLWEKFIYVSLRKQIKPEMNISSQTSKYFWESVKGNRSSIRPDILLTTRDKIVVLDTKWKNIGDKNPSPDDLRQLYIYHEYYDAMKVALIYPGDKNIISGTFFMTEKEKIKASSSSNPIDNKICSIIKIPTNTTITNWQASICELVYDQWLTPNEN